MLAGATWVGNRRWDLRFQTGETLSLPEGKEEASTALVNFARMDGVNRLLGRGILRFDMRDPDKFVLRLPKTQGTVASKSKDSAVAEKDLADRSEEHTSDLQSLMRISYAVFCLKKKTNTTTITRKTLSS